MFLDFSCVRMRIDVMTMKPLILSAFLCLAVLCKTTGGQGFQTVCVPGTIFRNMTLAKGIGAGTYHRVGAVQGLQECLTKVCARGEGDIAYLLNTFCYAVKCISVETCDKSPLPFSQDLMSIVVDISWKEVAITTTNPAPVDYSLITPGPQPTVQPGPKPGPDGKFATSTEHRLMQDIIYSSMYNREVRPVVDHEDQLKLLFQLKLVQIVDVSEKDESLRINVWTTQEWRDPFLVWDPAKYDGIDTINVEPNMVWLPIVILYNNAASGFTGGLEKYKTKVVIDNNGTVKWFSATQFLASCKINIQYFPFDEQYCYMTFGSWTYSTKHMDMLTTQVEADMTSYIKNGEWEVLEAPVKANKVQYPCCEDTFSDITYTIHIRRKVAYYVFNLIIPSMMIVVFALVGFCLPPESGERIALNITVLLSMTVFLNIASNTLPATSDSIPLLGYFYLMIMIELCLAIVVTTIVLRFYHYGHVRMPDRLRLVINEWIASMLFFFITTKPKDKGIYQCLAAADSSDRTCKWLMAQTTTRSQSYNIQQEDHHPTEDRVSLLDYTTPILKRRQMPAIVPPVGMTKSRSEPAINSAGVVSTTKVHHHRPRTSGGPKRQNINTIIQRKISEGFSVLTKRVKDEGEKDECILEWQFAATVLDRLCFVIFFVSMCVPLLFFFFSSPENQPPIRN